jgi:hypothetical protein
MVVGQAINQKDDFTQNIAGGGIREDPLWKDEMELSPPRKDNWDSDRAGAKRMLYITPGKQPFMKMDEFPSTDTFSITQSSYSYANSRASIIKK